MSKNLNSTQEARLGNIITNIRKDLRNVAAETSMSRGQTEDDNMLESAYYVSQSCLIAILVDRIGDLL